MRPRPLGAALAAVALAGVAAPSSGTARTVPHLFQVVSYAPLRVWDETAGIPFAMPEARRTVAYRVGGATYRGPWVPASVSRGSNTEILREIDRRVRQGSARVDGAFVDRRLTAGERRRFVQVADLYRDADVLVVTTGHPACAGLGRAQARAIAAGRVRRWAQVIPGTPGAIALRHQRSPSGTAVPRFGTALGRGGGIAGARTARLRPDGGIAEAARGDRAVAGVTSWALARRAGASVCAVPLGGIAPTDETVRALRYPEAYPVAYVVPRRAPRAAIDRRTRQVFTAYVRSTGLAESLRRRGALLPRGPAPPAGGPGAPPAGVPSPATDHLGRPITAAPASAAAEAALTGLRAEVTVPEGRQRLVLEPAGTARRLTLAADGQCLGRRVGGWTVRGGWRYPEHGGGLVARLGWFLDPGVPERTLVLPDAEPATVYVDGVAHTRTPGAAADCP